MKFILIIVLVSCVLDFSLALVCTKNACSRIRCKQVTYEDCRSNGQEYVEHGGWCGCCSVCMTLLGKLIMIKNSKFINEI